MDRSADRGKEIRRGACGAGADSRRETEDRAVAWHGATAGRGGRQLAAVGGGVEETPLRRSRSKRTAKCRSGIERAVETGGDALCLRAGTGCARVDRA